MRASFAPSVAVLSSVLFVSLASFSLVACGGETASLGSQGQEQGTGGKDGGAGTSGGGSSSGGNSSGGSQGNCATISITCDASSYKTNDANGCEACAACPPVPAFLGDCPNGSRDVRDPKTNCVTATVCKDECPLITPPNPDFCKGGELTSNKSEQGCDLPPTCVCPPASACPPGSKAQPKLNGACGFDCVPSSCPDIVAPGPNQCPSGGFVPTYDAGGCLVAYECKSCPVVGDPSYCADGTVRVGIKDGKCDYGNVSCEPCASAEPPVLGFCNDGKKVVKKDGLCLGAAECSCPEFDACPAHEVVVAVPGSACGFFVCNKAACPKVADVGGLSCDGNFEWQRDANDCVSTLVCTAPK